ncbi:MAG: GDP-mannose 4,6-dehydratase [Acidobacteriota bacterium]
MSSVTLVTGAAGFAGGHLLDLLVGEGTPVVAWRRPGGPPSRRWAADPRVRWADVELLDREAVAAALADLRPAAVYHLAGAPHVGLSWANTREFYEANVRATHHLFEGLRRAGVAPRVLVSSSATVYKPADRPLREDDPTGATSPYGTSKLAQDLLCRAAWESDGLPVLIARAFNHTGPGQDPSFVAPGIARQVALIESGQAPPVLAMGNLEPKRDLTDVRDVVRGYRAMMAAATPGVPYNVCSGRPIAIRTLVDTFLARTRVTIRIERDPARFRPNDVPFLVGDHSRLTADTGWRPEIPIDDTVDALLAYWRAEVARG